MAVLRAGTCARDSGRNCKKGTTPARKKAIGTPHRKKAGVGPLFFPLLNARRLGDDVPILVANLGNSLLGGGIGGFPDHVAARAGIAPEEVGPTVTIEIPNSCHLPTLVGDAHN